MGRIKAVWAVLEVFLTLAGLAVECLCADPTPPPIPSDTPVASIVVTDANGLPIEGEVGLGQQIILSSTKAIHGKSASSLAWLIEPKMQQFTIPVGTTDPDGKDIGGTVVLTTPQTACDLIFMQIVGMGDKVAWQRIKVKCGQGSQPPPGPIPPGPTPPPVPTASKLFMAVVEESVLKRTPEQLTTLSAIGVWNSFRVNGGDWRFYDAATTNEVKGKKAAADVAAAGVKLPALVTYNFDTGILLDVRPLPLTVKDLQAVHDKFTGK